MDRFLIPLCDMIFFVPELDAVMKMVTHPWTGLSHHEQTCLELRLFEKVEVWRELSHNSPWRCRRCTVCVALEILLLLSIRWLCIWLINIFGPTKSWICDLSVWSEVQLEVLVKFWSLWFRSSDLEFDIGHTHFISTNLGEGRSLCNDLRRKSCGKSAFIWTSNRWNAHCRWYQKIDTFQGKTHLSQSWRTTQRNNKLPETSFQKTTRDQTYSYIFSCKISSLPEVVDFMPWILKNFKEVGRKGYNGGFTLTDQWQYSRRESYCLPRTAVNADLTLDLLPEVMLLSLSPS